MGLIRLFKTDLTREIRSWEEKGLVEPHQARAIAGEYGIDLESKTGRGYYILVTLGYFFLGLTLITLVAANWEEIPRHLRMIGLIALTLVIQLQGFRLLCRGRIKEAGGAFLLGALAYGAAIMLIAQVYHIGEHYPDGVLYWGLGVIPLGLLTGSATLLSLSTFLGFIWFFMEGGLGVFPWLFPVFLLPLAWHIRQVKPSRSLFIYLVVGLGLFLEYFLAWALGGFWEPEFGVEALVLAWAFFVVCHGISRFLGRRSETDLKDYAALLGVWSLRFFLVALLFMGFEPVWEELFHEDWTWSLPMFALASLAALFHILSFGTRGKRQICAGCHLLFLVLFFGTLYPGGWATPRAFQVVSNLAMVAAGAGLIVQGVRTGQSHYFFLGICAVLATGILRYMDLIGDYMGTAALFAGCALILLVSARYWKGRKGGENE